MQKLPIVIILALLCHARITWAQAQTEKIAGKVVDAQNGSPLVGATISISDNRRGASTDAEGGFFLVLERNKKYTLTISSVGYTAKQLTDVEVTGANTLTLNVSLERTGKQLEGVVVRATARREAQASLYAVQKNSSAISDGISAELIRRSPDKNTGDVLKRVSGASVQDNKFVVIRGLSERYNVSLLNNSTLPSTEADKKAFAFDIIPSSIVDNLVIYKSSTPDLPGDFSGGAIKVLTKDYPSRKLSDLSLSIGYNSLTTGKNFYTGHPNGSMDQLGFFDHSRQIPGPYYRNQYGFISKTDAFKKDVTKMFSNSFGYDVARKSLPTISAAYTGGNTALLGNGNKLGYVYSLGYSNGRSVNERERPEWDITSRNLYDYNTVNYEEKNNLTALFNLTWSYRKSKISFKNLFNNNFVKTVGLRTGSNFENVPDVFYIKGVNSEASNNGIVNSVVEGLHKLSKTWTVDWNGSFGWTYRNQPDQKILTFRTPENTKSDYYITLNNENSPEIRNAGRVNSFLSERIYGASANATKEFQWLGNTQKLKFGTANYYRDRNVEALALGYASLDPLGRPVTIHESKTTTFDNIWSAANIDTYDLTVANIEKNSISYDGSAMLNAGYLMLDNKFSEKVRLTWGTRVERYRQELSARNKGKKVYTNTDFLPSLLLTYALNNKTNLRLSGSRAVNRPEFRELANYATFDYENYVTIIGNPNLVRCINTNGDLRYEWFPAAGEIVSGSLFYKYFKNPIEQTNQANENFGYINADHATSYGAEIEIRKKLDFIGGGLFNQLTFYTNAAYIKGSVQLDTVKINSPLQGQSTYLINGGLNYTSADDQWSFNILYNRIGPRLRYRAVNGAAFNVFEKPRDLLDLQVSKKFISSRLEAKLTVSDVFAQSFAWYYKFEQNPKSTGFDPAKDKVMNSTKYGTSASLSIRYNLTK